MLTGGGYLLKVPAVDLAEVGAGGGSIVWIDDGGSIQIGPESAGAVPGPLCYDLGGTRPTVTDANVILGYINPDYLVGGELPLNAALSRSLFADMIADPLGLDPVEAAYGAHRIAVSRMIRAIRAVSSERGRDPRAFTLFAFGGNGPLFAAGMAAELAMKKIIVPPAAGLFSARGLLYADVEHHFSKTRRCLVRDADPALLDDLWHELEEAARAQLTVDGFAGAGIDCRRFASLRYQGQIYELSVPAPERFAMRRRSTTSSGPSATNMRVPMAIVPAPTRRSSWSMSRFSVAASVTPCRPRRARCPRAIHCRPGRLISAATSAGSRLRWCREVLSPPRATVPVSSRNTTRPASSLRTAAPPSTPAAIS